MSQKPRVYTRAHERVARARGKATTHSCVGCGKPAQEWAQIHDTDGEQPEHYQPMCCSCHNVYDDHWNEETRAKVSATLKDYWSSPAGVARREAMRGSKRAAGKRTPEQVERIKAGAAEGRRRAAERRLAALEGGGDNGVR